VITSLTALKHSNKILGVRMGLSDGSKYDIPYTDCRRMGLDPSLLPSVQVWLSDGKWVSQEELDSWTTVKELNRNSPILRTLLTSSGVLGGKINLDIDKCVLAEKKYDIRKKYQTALYGGVTPSSVFETYGHRTKNPAIKDSWVDEAVEYNLRTHDNDFNHTLFGKWQVYVLGEYSRWRSKGLFDDESLHIRFSLDRKNRDIAHRLAGGHDDGYFNWCYDGMIDTMFFDSDSVCDMGFRSRYKHFARNMITNKVISFGADTMSELFYVGDGVLEVLYGLQETVSLEIRLMDFLVNTGKSKACLDGLGNYGAVRDFVYSQNRVESLHAKMLDSFKVSKLPIVGHMWGIYGGMHSEWAKDFKIKMAGAKV